MSDLPDYFRDPTPCPSCDQPLDGHLGTRPGQAGPKPGDISICVYCAELLVYGDGLRLAIPDEALRADLMTDPHITRALAVVRATKEN